MSSYSTKLRRFPSGLLGHPFEKFLSLGSDLIARSGLEIPKPLKSCGLRSALPVEQQ